jgi:hypothetical protein
MSPVFGITNSLVCMACDHIETPDAVQPVPERQKADATPSCLPPVSAE